MSVLGQYLASKGHPVDDHPVLGRLSPWQRVEFIVWHHYGAANQEDQDSAPASAQYLRRGGSYPPNAHLYVDLTGLVWVICQERPGQPVPGRATHMGRGSWPGIPTDRGNEVALGIEVQCDGSHKISTHPVLFDRLVKVTVDLLDFYNLDVEAVIGHDDYAGAAQGKIDPRESLAEVRAAVEAEMARREADKVVLRAQVMGDTIDADDGYLEVFNALPKKDKPDPKIIVLGDLVHRNSPAAWWEKKWAPTYGSLDTCKVWSVLGNHGWGWTGKGRWPAAKGKTYWEYRSDFHENCPMAMRKGYCWAKRRPGWLILGLDSEHPAQSYRFMREALRRFGRKRKVLVLIHRPPILPPGSDAPRFRGPRLRRLIKQRADLVMSGHSHRFWRKGKYIVVGTGDGKGWANLALRSDGTWTVRFRRL